MGLSRTDIRFFKLAVGTDRITQENDNDITARCPVCGDSAKNNRKGRLHLYNKGSVTNCNCFNGDCPAQNKTLYAFLRDFFPSILPQYKRETFKSTIKNMSELDNSDVFKGLQPKQPEPEKPVQCYDLSPYMTDINEKQEALQYISTRGLSYTGEYGKWYYGHQNLKIDDVVYPITDSIIIPLYCNKEMYGFYSRSIKSKSFYTYMNNNNIGYKIFNWFNVNKDEPVYIFEGIFDAISSGLPNVIALLGAKLPEARLKELKQPVFVLDNDKTGLLNSVYYSKYGKVYVQPSNLIEKDMNELMQNHPNINVSDVIMDNLFSGLSAEIRIKRKL